MIDSFNIAGRTALPVSPGWTLFRSDFTPIFSKAFKYLLNGNNDMSQSHRFPAIALRGQLFSFFGIFFSHHG